VPAEFPEPEIARVVAEAVGHAPSAGDTAPWWFSTTATEFCVRADFERQLPVRDLLISCGAAAFTARVALRYLGREPRTQVLPAPDLVAQLDFAGQGRPATEFERALYDQVSLRRGFHGDFAHWRLPAGLMSSLEQDAAREGARLTVLADDNQRAVLLAVLDAANRVTRSAPASTGWGGAEPGTNGIIAALTTAADERADWVAAGQALQRVLLTAATHGVPVAMHSSPVEFASLREFLRTELAGGDYPQLVLRFGSG